MKYSPPSLQINPMFSREIGKKPTRVLPLLLAMVLVLILFSVQFVQAGDGTITEDNPITELKLVKTTNKDDDPPSCGSGWYRIDTNLQAGGLPTGKGDFKEPAWYLCYQTGDPSNAITHLYPIVEAHVGGLGRSTCYDNDVKVKDQNGDANVNAEGWKVQSDYLCYGRDGDYPLLGINIKTTVFVPEGYVARPPNVNPKTGSGATGQTFNFGGTLLYVNTRDKSSLEAEYTFDCGGEGEKPCSVFTSFWWENGNFACDRGLREWSGECINGLDGFDRYNSNVVSFLEGSQNGAWVLWALDNQRTNLAIDEPLNWVTHLGSHNSFNNRNDSYFVDPSQKFSITDQLTLGARRLSLDLHFYNGEVRLCHGKESGAGCVATERLYFNIIKELGTWLDRNPGEFVIVHTESYVDSEDADAVNVPIDKYIGDRVYRHEDYAEVLSECLSGQNPCTETEGHRWPTIRELRAAGKQVMFMGGDGAFGDQFFTEGGLTGRGVNDFFGSQSAAGSFVYPDKDKKEEGVDCLDYAIWASNNDSVEALKGFYDQNLTHFNIREDRTIIGNEFTEGPGAINAERVSRLVQCNVWISMDFFGFQEGTEQFFVCDDFSDQGLVDACTTPDGRLKAAVWSWRDGDVGQNGGYALLANSDKRWVSQDGSGVHHFACAFAREEENPLNLADREGQFWFVTAATGTWEEGSAACAAEFGSDFLFNVPVNAWQNEKLKQALENAKIKSGYDTASDDVWLNYREEDDLWIPGRSPKVSLSYSSLAGGAPTEGFSTEFTNIAVNDGLTLTYDWSVTDFGGSVLATSSAEKFNYTFPDNGRHIINLTITDEAGQQASDRLVLIAQNANPTAVFAAGGPVSEGSPGQVTFSGQDDPSTVDLAAGFTYSYDFDGDGIFDLVDDPSPSTAIPGSYLDDGPGAQTVTGRIKDKNKGYSDYTATIEISNVPPSAVFGNQAGPINEGFGASLFANPTDPSTTDVTEGLRYIYGGEPRGQQNTASTDPGINGTLLFDCNDNPLDEFRYADGVDAGLSSCIFVDGPSDNRVSARIIDKDEGWREYTGTVSVRNVPPDVHTPQMSTANGSEGSIVSASASFTDPGVLDEPLTCTVNYGDGTGDQAGIVTVSEKLVEIIGSCTGPNHVYADNDLYTITVKVTDKDHSTTVDGQGGSTTTYQVDNVKPTVNAGLDRLADEGTTVSLAAATFNDIGTLDTHRATVNWGDGTATEEALVTESPYGPPGSPAGANGSIDASHVYADNGVYTVEVCVADDEGAKSCATTEVNVKNVAPTVNAGLDAFIDESGTFSLDPAGFHDQGTLDTHTATINWDDGATRAASTQEAVAVSENPFGPPGSTSGADGTVAGSFVYGDNGIYDVQVCVSDDDGATTCDQVRVQVKNLKPTVKLDKSAAISFAGGPAFLLRRGVAETFQSTGSDKGSDDLTFAWTFPPGTLGSETTYFNNGLDADPQHSPHGVYPFNAADSNETTFSFPGFYEAVITVSDDDGGSAEDSLSLLMTDSRQCTAVPAIWANQYGPGGQQTIDDLRLQGYLDIIRFASAYFNDDNLADAADAAVIFRDNGGSNQILKKQALAAWLNYASGGVLWNQEIPLIRRPFHEVIGEIDAVLLAGNPSQAEINDAHQAAIHINTMSPAASSCNDLGTP